MRIPTENDSLPIYISGISFYIFWHTGNHSFSRYLHSITDQLKVRCCRRCRVVCRFDGEGGFRFVLLKDINNIGVFVVDQSGSLTCHSTLSCYQRDKAMAEEKEMLKGEQIRAAKLC